MTSYIPFKFHRLYKYIESHILAELIYHLLAGTPSYITSAPWLSSVSSLPACASLLVMWSIRIIQTMMIISKRVLFKWWRQSTPSSARTPAEPQQDSLQESQLICAPFVFFDSWTSPNRLKNLTFLYFDLICSDHLLASCWTQSHRRTWAKLIKQI